MAYTRNQQVVIGLGAFFILAALALAIAALILVVRSPSSNQGVFMARTNVATQTITGGVPVTVLFDTLEGATSGFTYTDGKFTALQAGVYSFVGNLSINVSGPSASGAATIGPMTAWVVKENSVIQYSIGNFIPLESTPGVSGNSQYIQWSTMIQMDTGESVSVQVLSATEQQIVPGAASYAAIGVTHVT